MRSAKSIETGFFDETDCVRMPRLEKTESRNSMTLIRKLISLSLSYSLESFVLAKRIYYKLLMIPFNGICFFFRLLPRVWLVD